MLICLGTDLSHYIVLTLSGTYLSNYFVLTLSMTDFSQHLLLALSGTDLSQYFNVDFGRDWSFKILFDIAMTLGFHPSVGALCLSLDGPTVSQLEVFFNYL